MNRSVTMFEKFFKDVGDFTMEEILARIKSGHYGYVIRVLRRMLREGNHEGYNQAKKKLPACTFSATFLGGRKMQFMLVYMAIVILDLDNLTEEELIRAKKIICLCEYTLACFVSPSGNGLKVLVAVSTGAEHHKEAFNSVRPYYMALTGLEIDPSGKDITRLCFMSLDPELYHNPGARIFQPLIGEGEGWPVVKTDPPVLLGSQIKDGPLENQEGQSQESPLPDEMPHGEEATEIQTWANQQPVSDDGKVPGSDAYTNCIQLAEKLYSYVVGSRHQFVFTLTLLMRRAGFTEGLTSLKLLQDYNFDEREVKNCIKSVYSYVWTDDPLLGKPKPATDPISVGGCLNTETVFFHFRSYYQTNSIGK